MELKYFLFSQFRSSSIEQKFTKSHKVRTENLKFRTDLKWLVSNTADDCLQRQIAQQILKLKIEGCLVNSFQIEMPKMGPAVSDFQSSGSDSSGCFSQ